jgi:hypothetical protein
VRRQESVADHAPNGRGTYFKGCACFIDCYLAAIGAFAFAVRRYLVVMTQRANTVARPAIATTCRPPRTVQNGDNRVICHLTSEHLHKVDNIGVGHPLVLTNPISLGAQACVITAMPMDDQLELIANDISDDLGDQQTNDLLARFNACAGFVPGPCEVTAQCKKAFPDLWY